MMKYLDQLKYFEQWTEGHYLPGKAQLMWFKLMQFNNRLHWQKRFNLDNHRLVAMVDASCERDVIRTRQVLIDEGLLRFTKGHKGHPSQYEMLPFWSDDDGVVHAGAETHEDCDDDVSQSVTQCVTQSVSNEEVKKQEDPVNFDELMNYWNTHCGEMPKIKNMTETRKKRVRSLMKQYTPKDLKTAIDKASHNSFMNGGGDRGWKGSFDFVTKPANMQKILEDTYEYVSGGGKKKTVDDVIDRIIGGENLGGNNDPARNSQISQVDAPQLSEPAF